MLHKTVRELESSITPSELAEWIAYFRIEAMPDAHWDAALVASTIANFNGTGKKTFQPDDFYPKPEVREAMSPEESAAAFKRAMTAGFAVEEV